MSARDDLPPRLRKAMARPSGDRRAWSAQLAGVLIAGYLWVAYPDTLATTTLAVGGLGPAIGGAAAGGLLACVLLFIPAASQGLRTRQPLMVAATSAFGIRGSALVPGLILAMVQIVWFAVAVHYAVAFTLRGLLSAGLIDPRHVRPAGDGWLIHHSTVYAATALLWGVASALVATRFIRWVAALMVVYPIFIALALGGAMLWAIPGLPEFRAASADPRIGLPRAAWPAFWEMTQLVFGFSATVAAQSVNWGSTLRGRRDVVLAGVVGVGLASTIIATLAVLTVAGSIGRELAGDEAGGAVAEAAPAPIDLEPAAEALRDRSAMLLVAADPYAYTIGAVFEGRIGGLPGAVGLIVLGLGSLAFAVYSAFAYSNRLEAIRARPRRWAWGVIGAVVAFPLMTTGLAANVPLVIDLTAGVVAPMLGVLAADLVAHRAAWPGPRPGFRPSGLIAWGLGAAVGLLPVVARVVPGLGPCRWLPMAVAAFLLAFAAAAAIEAIAGGRVEVGSPPPSTSPAGPS